jgi:hypothetical protein
MTALFIRKDGRTLLYDVPEDSTQWVIAEFCKSFDPFYDQGKLYNPPKIVEVVFQRKGNDFPIYEET